MLKPYCAFLVVTGVLATTALAGDAPRRSDNSAREARGPAVNVVPIGAGGMPERGERTVARRIGTLGEFLTDNLEREKARDTGHVMPTAMREDLDRIRSQLQSVDVWVVYDAPPAGLLLRSVGNIGVEFRNLKEVFGKGIIQSIDCDITLVTVNDTDIGILARAELKLASGALRLSNGDNAGFGTIYNIIIRLPKIQPEKPGVYGLAREEAATRPTQ